MIIGNNTNMTKNPFVKGDNTPIATTNQIEKNRAMQHTDVMSKDEMNDRAFAMLQERLSKGLITMDEFNKMCNQLGRKNK